MTHKNILLMRFLTLCIALFMVAVPSMKASAALRGCRTDPIFTLSNGDVVTVTLDVDTDADNVKEVNYILHVPAGVTPVSVEFTPGILGKKETYSVIGDSPDGVYTSDSFVKSTKDGNLANVIVNMDVNSIDFQSIAGSTNQNLIITLNTKTISSSNSGTITFSSGRVDDGGKIKTKDDTIVIVSTPTN